MTRIKGSIHPWSGHHSQPVCEQFHDSDCRITLFDRRCPSFYISFERTFQYGYITNWHFHTYAHIPQGWRQGPRSGGKSQNDMWYILYWNYLKQIGKILVHWLYCTGKQINAVLVNRICWDVCPKLLSLYVSLIKTKKFLY